jgi:hypothetical protein
LLKGPGMTQYIFRLANASDRPTIHRLQEQCSIELNAPLAIIGADPMRSEFLRVEALQHGSTRAVGLISITRASSAPFVFELVFPDVWQRIDLATLTGREGLRREELVELDMGYVEKPHRTRQLTLLTLAGGLLHAHRQGYPVGVGIASTSALARVPADVFRGTGLVRMVAGAPYELGTFLPDRSVPLMAEVVQEACARDNMVPWHLEVR